MLQRCGFEPSDLTPRQLQAMGEQSPFESESTLATIAQNLKERSEKRKPARQESRVQPLVSRQQVLKRSVMASQEQPPAGGRSAEQQAGAGRHRRLQMQQRPLDQNNESGRNMSRREHTMTSQAHTVVHQEQNGTGSPARGSHPLRDYQIQLSLLEKKHKERHMMARQGQGQGHDQHEDNTNMDIHLNYECIHDTEFDALLIEVCDRSLSKLPPSSTQPKLTQLSEKYPAKAHARKVKDELDVRNGLVYLVGQKEKNWEDTDGEMPFRQRRFVSYLSGANFPGVAITYDIAKDYLILWVPTRKPSEVLWKGTVPSPEECMQSYDVDSVRDIKHMKVYLEKLLDPRTKLPTVYVLHKDERPPPLRWERPGGGAVLEPDAEVLVPAMSRARVVKTPYEISQIRKAVDISSQAHREVLKHIKHLKNEAQVESLFLSKCRELGAKQQAYPPIAGSGPNASVLHYSANNQDFGNRQLLVLDAGCEFECYASDVTRTFPLNGRFTKEAKKIYQLVLKMQQECIDMIRPGQQWSTVTLKAIEVARQGLLNIGILQTGRSGNAPGYDALELFFPHGLGHLVGLDTHDVIAYANIRGSTMPAVFGGKRHSLDSLTADGHKLSASAQKYGLKEGMVITCEPGLYFNRAYIEYSLAKMPEMDKYVNKALLKDYYPVGGCRLEDCILVIKDGFENLTTAPKGHEMIRVINGGA